MKLRTIKELGVLIRDARRQAGLTQAQVADQMRATQKWVSAVENGKDTAEIGQVLRLLALLRLDITVEPANSEALAPSPAQEKTLAMDIRKLRLATTTRHPNVRNIDLPPVPPPKLPEGGLDLDVMLDDMKGNKPG
jgi:transcriptional regulator with XRE-family HTH domain